MDLKAALGHSSLFENISEQSLEALAEICVPKTLKKKEHLFLEGDKGYSLYILGSGNIQLYKTTPDGREVVIKVVKPGEIFAEVILFEQDRYPVSAVSLSECKVFMIPKHNFSCLLANQQFRSDFIFALMKKMRYLAGQIEYLTHHDVEERLFMFFREQYGDQKRFRCKLSKKDVAAAVGATPETLSRLILRLKKEGKLSWEGSVVEIL